VTDDEKTGYLDAHVARWTSVEAAQHFVHEARVNSMTPKQFKRALRSIKRATRTTRSTSTLGS
jgi:hypothetical protein